MKHELLFSVYLSLCSECFIVLASVIFTIHIKEVLSSASHEKEELQLDAIVVNYIGFERKSQGQWGEAMLLCPNLSIVWQLLQ